MIISNQNLAQTPHHLPHQPTDIKQHILHTLHFRHLCTLLRCPKRYVGKLTQSSRSESSNATSARPPECGVREERWRIHYCVGKIVWWSSYMCVVSEGGKWAAVDARKHGSGAERVGFAGDGDETWCFACAGSIIFYMVLRERWIY